MALSRAALVERAIYYGQDSLALATQTAARAARQEDRVISVEAVREQAPAASATDTRAETTPAAGEAATPTRRGRGPIDLSWVIVPSTIEGGLRNNTDRQQGAWPTSIMA